MHISISKNKNFVREGGGGGGRGSYFSVSMSNSESTLQVALVLRVYLERCSKYLVLVYTVQYNLCLQLSLNINSPIP